MANPTNLGLPKDKDDDSWGKLATDLFGIQFDTSDDDFDLTEDEPAVPQPELKTGPTLADVVPAGESAHAEPEPDLSFPDEGDAASEPEYAQEIAETPRAEIESEKDIWDLLETWNWDEQPKESGRARHSESADRGSEPRRGRESRGERSRDRGERSQRPERPARSRDAESEPAGERVREERPRREERPARGERDRKRSGRSNESRPPRTEEPTPRAASGPVDEFAFGIDDEAPRAQPERERQRERPKAGPRRPAPAPRAPQRPVDDFEGDLFEELEAAPAAESPASDEGERGERGAEPSGEERRPRRRRRRRGDRGERSDRGERGRREESARVEPDREEPAELEEEVAASADDEFGVIDEMAEDRGDSEREPRRRRRRRRVRRRGAEPVERTESEADAEELAEESDEQTLEGEAAFEEEEAVVAVSYEGIPSWEEAISYLQRRPREARRSDGRGRGGPNRR